MVLLRDSKRNASAPIDVQSDRLGATPDDEGRTRFLLWAPEAARCEVHLVHPVDLYVEMSPLENGYFGAIVEDCTAGARYFYRVNGKSEFAAPTSRCQPEGVHGPSEVVAPRVPAVSAWQAPELRDYIIYELHIGTFTPEGTLDAAIPHLHRLKDLGITAIELMPVAEFPGGRNWGYDGVYPNAVEYEYGGQAAMGRFVDACHRLEIAVILDVVYNHLGPEGNYVSQFGPYFTSRYHTPWGDAINFDGPRSDEVRRFFIDNAVSWIEEFGIDALRLDAVHAIFDQSARPFLQELGETLRTRAEALGRRVFLIAESDLNDARVITPVERGGLGIDAQWADDFHHCLHSLLTGETSGYYASYGKLEQLAKAMQQGWTYTGEYSVFRQRRFGNSPERLEPHQLVVCAQNHDQVGNRMNGERLTELAGWDGARLAAAAVILSPYTPLLFMGEEYGEPAPFLYHVSHSDISLQEAVRLGRRSEFAEFHAEGEPPDPQAPETFLLSKLNQALVREGRHGQMHSYYRRLIEIRKNEPSFRARQRGQYSVRCLSSESTIVVERFGGEQQALVFLHFGERERQVRQLLPRRRWTKLLDSSEAVWGGPGPNSTSEIESKGAMTNISLPPRACVIYSADINLAV